MNLRTFIIKAEFNQMSNYLTLVKKAIDQRLEEIGEEYNELDPDTRDELNDYYIDSYIDTGRDFPQLLLTSFIITWYSFVEKQLIQLCEGMNLTINVGLRDQLNIGTGIRRAKFFLENSKNYSIDNSHWQELVRIGKLRNRLVHDDIRLSTSFEKSDTSSFLYKFNTEDGENKEIYIHIRKDLFQYLNKQNMIEQTGSFSFEIRPTFEYCEQLIAFGSELFSKLYSDLYPKYPPLNTNGDFET